MGRPCTGSEHCLPTFYSLSFFHFPLRARLAEPHDAEEKQMLRKGRHLPKLKQQGSSRAGLPGQAV